MTDAQPNPFIEHPAEYRRHENSDEQFTFQFANGHGASALRGPRTYGGSVGLWEFAVLDSAGRVDTATPVAGWLSTDAVRAALGKVAALPVVVPA